MIVVAMVHQYAIHQVPSAGAVVNAPEIHLAWGIEPAAAASLFALGQSEVGRQCGFAMMPTYGDWEGCHDKLAHQILKDIGKDLEAIVWIDGDMGFSPQDFEALVAEGRTTKAVVGGYYPHRTVQNMVVGSPLDQPVEACFSPLLSEAEHVGFGFTYTPATCFRGLREPWIAVGHDAKGLVTPDANFCRKVRREQNIKVWGRAFEGLSHAFQTRRNMNALRVQGRR